ncbi:PaaX family transcriptional regulator [Actinomadura macra]|uniref:PaaX family transcriptional regulator n=1 Tax=Actinomadura macra TaxID=46164 RepID=UPI000A935DBF|nr:PaaX family transcriptional regulator C-terminal domain-containing protein [Actinomadura macra]
MPEAVPETASGTAEIEVPRARPQSLMLTFLGNYVLGRDVAVFSGSFIEVLGRLGVGEHAVRSTLSRMVARGLLTRHRDGRRVFFGLTERSRRVLADGEERVWERGVVNDDWDGGWTVLAFSLPESWQSRRHELRSRLAWAGFGPVGNGLWISPARVDVAEVTADLGLDAHVRVFAGPVLPPTDEASMIRDAFDLDAIAAGYRAWLDRWDHPEPAPEAPDDLARYLLVTTEWLDLVRADPRIPLRHLPYGWPAIRAQERLYTLRDRYQARARDLADRSLELAELR